MLQLVLKSYFAFLLIPLLTLALEPTNPTGLCDRLLGDAEKTQCLAKTEKGELDWYAAEACSRQEEDKNFLNCLDEVKGAVFNPQALELCAKSTEGTDEGRLSCIQKVKNKDYSRTQLKKCETSGSPRAVEACLSVDAGARAPAAAASLKVPQGFQSLEIRK
jgi:hypothetical protein